MHRTSHALHSARPRSKSPVRALLSLLVIAASLTGCQLTDPKSERVRVDWSRGEKLGRAVVNARPSLTQDSAGQIYLLWGGQAPEETPETGSSRSGRQALHFALLDRDGQVVAERDLAIEVDRPTAVEALASAPGFVHVFWLDQLDGATHLFHAGVDSAGEIVLGPSRIPTQAGPGSLVDSFALGLNPQGDVDLFMAIREWEQAGIYHLRLSETNGVLTDLRQVRSLGYGPSFRYDGAGGVHLTWLETPDYGERRLYYATFDSDSRTLGEPALVHEFPLPLGLVARRPAIGLVSDQVYVFWSVERRGGGLSRPAASSYYVSFPMGQPSADAEIQPVLIPGLTQLKHQPTTSVFAVSQVASAIEDLPSARFVYMPSTTEGNLDELAVAFSTQLSGRTQNTVQVVLTLWDESGLLGYQIAAKTHTSSLNPTLIVDENRDLHLAWIDTAGFGAYDVYYASTADAVERHLNRVTPQDVAAAVFGVVWGVGQSFSFLPLMLVWGFLPLVLLVAYVMIRAESRLDRMAPKAVLVASALVYTLCKFLFRPGWLAALPLPYGTLTSVTNLVSFAMPVVISGLAGVCTWLYARRSETASLFSAFAVFAVCDALLTVLIYVPGILAE